MKECCTANADMSGKSINKVLNFLFQSFHPWNLHATHSSLSFSFSPMLAVHIRTAHPSRKRITERVQYRRRQGREIHSLPSIAMV